jgi:polyisoprenyl-teichoic acid--peptidoglycan teichoic acid transferase
MAVSTGVYVPTYEGSPRRRRDPRWPRTLLILGVVTATAAGLFLGGSALFNRYAGGKVPIVDLGIDTERGRDISGPINILLLGMDERSNSDVLIHTDSVIIVHINAAHTAAWMVSLPRDALVSAPAFPESQFPGRSQVKLSEVFAFGNRRQNEAGAWVGDGGTEGRARGARLVSTVVKSLVPGGLTFNAVAIVNHAGFKKLVTALGGVHMCIDETVWSKHYDRDGRYVGDTHGDRSIAKTYKKACRHLAPWEALDYVRQRYYLELGDGDYGRQRHQQQFLAAVFSDLLSRRTLSDPKKLAAVINSAGELLTLDLGGNTVLDWMFTLRRIGSGDVTMIKTNAGRYASVRVNNQSFEQITPLLTSLLTSVRGDTVEAFLAKHPDWIAPSS